MGKVIFGFGMIILNFIICQMFNKILKKINILDITNLKFIPEWLKEIIGMLLIFLTCPAFIIFGTSGFVLYDLIMNNDVFNIILVIILMIISNIYINIVKVGK